MLERKNAIMHVFDLCMFLIKTHEEQYRASYIIKFGITLYFWTECIKFKVCKQHNPQK